MNKNQQVVITGSAGRVGRLLMNRLPDHGWSVTGCDVVPSQDSVVADITDLEAMTALFQGSNSVIHLAATPNAKPGWDVISRLNIEGTRTVLEAARRAEIRRFVFASSIHVIGGYPTGTPLSASLVPNPSGLYGMSKIAGEALLRLYSTKTTMHCVAVRICSFRERPENRRELVTWLSYDDCVQLFDRCLAASASNYSCLWGVSANAGLEIDDPIAKAIGYEPQDDASLFHEKVPVHHAPWPFLGGPVNAEAF